ncbi:uncharacterized protein LOC142988858 isoform X2 [Genypterus blacodes]|uniref:uncharacterized protein LOC142988858 isoform X2 n=1 Tax=Genypterus blacodes TaxID=154954 RepID=UPI003F757B5B
MDRDYPTLKRPQRKLCYVTNNESSKKRWAGELSLQDVDKIFDDLDSGSDGDELQPLGNTENKEREVSFPPQQSCRTEKPPEHQMDKLPKRKLPLPEIPPACPEKEIVMDTPFKGHRPLKTSSPIEGTVAVQEATASPIVFDSDEDGKEAELEPQRVQKPNVETDSMLDSPPNLLSLRKAKIPDHNIKVDPSCKDAPPLADKIPQKPQPAASDSKTETSKEENTDASERQQPKHTSPPEREAERVHRQPEVETGGHVGKCVPSFLQKLREAGQPKPACYRKFPSPAKAATPPPEPADDFLIMEDASPVWLSIPRKATTSKRRNKDSSADKESSSDKETNERQPETATKPQTSSKAGAGGQTGNQKTKKKKGKGDDASIPPETSTVQKETERMKVDGLGKDKDADLLSKQDVCPAGDTKEAEKKKKVKQQKLQKIPSKDCKAVEELEELEERPVGGSSSIADSDREQVTEKKSLKTSQAKRLKSDKGDKNADKSQPLKGRRGRKKKEIPKEQSDEEHRVTEDPCSPQQQAEEDPHAAEDVLTPEARRHEASNGKEQQKEVLGSDKGSSSEDSQLKRKRKQTGQWWLSSPERAEKPETTHQQPVIKKSRVSRTKPRAAAATSPAKAKNVGDLKKKQKPSTPPPPPPPRQTAKHKAKEKKSKNKLKGADAPGTDLDPMLQDPGLDSGPCSPLAFPQRDAGVGLGIRDQVFPKVYNPAHNGTPSRSALPHRGAEEQPNPSEADKRKRKPPSAWWRVEDTPKRPAAAAAASLQPQQFDPKCPKGRRTPPKQSRSPALGPPKNGNVAVLPKRPEPLLKGKLLSAPRTVKRSLAKFDDIFTSESPFAPSRPGTSQNNKHNVAVAPAEALATFSVDAAEASKEQNHQSTGEVQQESRCYSESTSTFLQSGPLYTIDLEQHEENEDVGLPSSRVASVPSLSVLSVSELCAPPLRPFVLEEKDKTNLTKWLKSFWSATGDSKVDVTSDHYDWYFYQGRAIGFQEDLQASSFCSGKILLGSYMKKPLWVDHSATTGFLVLTSSVTVTINGSESQYNPGQAFMVQCGHAYSIQNRTAHPAVLSFYRMLAESSD